MELRPSSHSQTHTEMPLFLTQKKIKRKTKFRAILETKKEENLISKGYSSFSKLSWKCFNIYLMSGKLWCEAICKHYQIIQSRKTIQNSIWFCVALTLSCGRVGSRLTPMQSVKWLHSATRLNDLRGWNCHRSRDTRFNVPSFCRPL